MGENVEEIERLRKERELDLEVIREDNKVIIAKERSTGKEIRMIKIDREEMKRAHDERIAKVALELKVLSATVLIRKLAKILSTEITVSSHNEVASELTELLELSYDEVGNPNLFHHPIKNLDPEIYGKANTFLKEVNLLFETMVEVFQHMKKLGKIKDFEVGRQPMIKVTVVTESPEFAKEINELSEKYGGTVEKEHFHEISTKIH